MRPRLVLTAIAVLAMLATPATEAATKAKPKKPPQKTSQKTYCKLLTDPSGDGRWPNSSPVVTSPSIDILSADIATGQNTMVAVLRLGNTDFSVTNDPWSRLGYSWSFSTTSSLGHTYGFTASLGFTGLMSYGASVDRQGVAVTDFKVIGNSFQWTIQRKVSPDLSRPKNIFRDFQAGSEVESVTADTAVAAASYPDRASSCVRAS